MEIQGNCSDTTDPICNFFPEAQAESRIIPGGLQVFSWSLGSGYSCSQTTVAAGQRLEPLTPPYTLIDCTKPDVATWRAGTTCEYDCPVDYLTDLQGQQSCTFYCTHYQSEYLAPANAWIPSDTGCGTRQKNTWTCQTQTTKSYYYNCTIHQYSSNYLPTYFNSCKHDV